MLPPEDSTTVNEALLLPPPELRLTVTVKLNVPAERLPAATGSTA
jgi:hypothetical protein